MRMPRRATTAFIHARHRLPERATTQDRAYYVTRHYAAACPYITRIVTERRHFHTHESSMSWRRSAAAVGWSAAAARAVRAGARRRCCGLPGAGGCCPLLLLPAVDGECAQFCARRCCQLSQHVLPLAMRFYAQRFSTQSGFASFYHAAPMPV